MPDKWHRLLAVGCFALLSLPLSLPALLFSSLLFSSLLFSSLLSSLFSFLFFSFLFYLLAVKAIACDIMHYLSTSTLPSHIYSTILSFAKVTCNTHKNKKLFSIPLKLVPSLAKLPLPYFPPSTGRSVSPHPKLVIPFFGAVLGGSPARRFPYFRS